MSLHLLFLTLVASLASPTPTRSPGIGELLEVRVLHQSNSEEIARIEIASPLEGIGSELARAFSSQLQGALRECKELEKNLKTSTVPIELSIELTSAGVSSIENIVTKNDPTSTCLEERLKLARWKWLPIGQNPIHFGMRIWGKGK
jgi:hypothetical protein